jgi:hypothetical protein
MPKHRTVEYRNLGGKAPHNFYFCNSWSNLLPRSGTAYRSDIRQSESPRSILLSRLTLQMEPTRCPATSVTSYQSMQRNIPEVRRPQIHRDQSLKFRINGVRLRCASLPFRNRYRVNKTAKAKLSLYSGLSNLSCCACNFGCRQHEVQYIKCGKYRYRHTSLIRRVRFQTTAVKRISP